MERRETILIEVEHGAGLGAALERASEMHCEDARAIGEKEALATCANALATADRLQWMPGISLVSYGEFVGPGRHRDLASGILRILAGTLKDGDRIWFHVEGQGSVEFYDYLVGEAVSSTRVELDNRRPDKLFTVFLAGGGAFLSRGYRSGLGGVPPGSEGDSIALFSGGRCGVEAFLSSARAGFHTRPLFLEMGGATPPDESRRAMMAAAIVASNVRPRGGEVLAGYVPKRAVEAIMAGGGWAFHRFLAEVAGRIARSSGERAVFVGLSPEPGYANAIEAYANAQTSLGVAFVAPQCCGVPRAPADEELEALLDEHRWRLLEYGPSAPREDIWGSSMLPGTAAEVAELVVSLKAEGEMARHEVLDGYLRARRRLQELLDGGRRELGEVHRSGEPGDTRGRPGAIGRG